MNNGMISKGTKANSKELKDAAFEKLRSEVATKEFIRAEIAELRLVIEKESLKNRYLTCGVVMLILVLNTPVGATLGKLLGFIN